MKKAKLIVGITMVAQAISFFILFLVYWNKKKSLAKTFAAFAAAGGVVGAYCLVTAGCCKNKELFDEDDYDDFDEDFEDLDVCEDDLLCSFDEENGEKKEEQA